MPFSVRVSRDMAWEETWSAAFRICRTVAPSCSGGRVYEIVSIGHLSFGAAQKIPSGRQAASKAANTPHRPLQYQAAVSNMATSSRCQKKQLRRDGEEVEQHISTAQQVGPPPPVQAEQKERQGSKGRNSCMAKPHFSVIVL